MLPYTPDHKTKIVSFYLETKSIIKTQRQFKKTFNTRKAPGRHAILSVVHKFLAHGSLANRNRGRSGRKRSKRSADAAKRVKEITTSDPRTSIRKVAQEAGCSWFTAHRTLRDDLGLTPYKIAAHQQLNERDRHARMTFSA